MDNGLSFSELLQYVNEETAKWREFFQSNPTALDVPVSIAGTKRVRDMLLHIFAVELRYAERLNHVAEVTPYERHTGSRPRNYSRWASKRVDCWRSIWRRQTIWIGC